MPRSIAELKEPRWWLTRRSVSVSATPIEAFGKLRPRSTESGSTPRSLANRSQISRLGASGPGSGSTCTRSGGTAGDQRSSTRWMSSVRQFQIAELSSDSVREYSDIGVTSRFLMLSCQLAVNRPSGSLPVTTTWTSAGDSSSTIRTAWAVEAAAKNSWLISAVPGQAATSARRRSQVPVRRSPNFSKAGSSRTTRLAHRCS